MNTLSWLYGDFEMTRRIPWDDWDISVKWLGEYFEITGGKLCDKWENLVRGVGDFVRFCKITIRWILMTGLSRYKRIHMIAIVHEFASDLLDYRAPFRVKKSNQLVHPRCLG